MRVMLNWPYPSLTLEELTPYLTRELPLPLVGPEIVSPNDPGTGELVPPAITGVGGLVLPLT